MNYDEEWGQTDSGERQEYESERTQTEEKIMSAELTKGFLRARKAIENPVLDSVNPHFNSKFASLKAVIDSVIVAAAEEGIAVMQDLQEAEGGVRCVTHLCHESGEEKTFGPLFFPSTKSNAQGYASASTYARRYHLQSIFCVVGEEDDDGNAASEGAFTSKAAFTKARNAQLKAAKDSDFDALAKISADLNNDQKAELWHSYTHPEQTLLKDVRKQQKEFLEEKEVNDD